MSEPAFDPVGERASDRVGERASDPVGGRASEPVGERASDPVGERASDPVGEPASDPVGEPASEPGSEPATRTVPLPTSSPESVGGFRRLVEEPYYLPAGNEIAVFEMCHRRKLAVMLKGPTGCGKTRFVEHMAWRLGRPLVTVACHDDLSASDLTGRYLIRSGETVWQDGPLALAARHGAICYLDEIVEARQDTVVVIHPLTDDRRILPVDKVGELIEAAPGFQLVVSYNPGYQHVLKDLKPSTRQRFVALEFDFPSRDHEIDIVAHECDLDRDVAVGLVTLAQRLRNLHDRGLAEVPSTRLLVATGRLIASGLEPREACEVALMAPLTDEPDLLDAIRDLLNATFT